VKGGVADAQKRSDVENVD